MQPTRHARSQEFNKKFRASDEFKKSVSEDKIESFGKVLQKFFDNEREDYKKDVAMKTPDYDALQKKANQAGCFGIILLGKKGSLSACFIKMDSDNLQPTTIIIVVIFFVVVIIQVSQ